MKRVVSKIWKEEFELREEKRFDWKGKNGKWSM
jgi:hypothetical protein